MPVTLTKSGAVPSHLLKNGKAQVSEKEKQKLERQKQQEKLMHPVFTAKATLGEKAADLLTKWAGSWVFILSFMVCMVLWVILNTITLVTHWDPVPFRLLNLMLSLLAAFQAPIILMSQNRQSQKDRIRAEYDYSVNRHAAREVEQIDKQLDRIERKIDALEKRRR